MSELACSSCRFYHANAREEGGQCRRYAPRPDMDDWWTWPGVASTTWCGEWQGIKPSPNVDAASVELGYVYGYLNTLSGGPARVVLARVVKACRYLGHPLPDDKEES